LLLFSAPGKKTKRIWAQTNTYAALNFSLLLTFVSRQKKVRQNGNQSNTIQQKRLLTQVAFFVALKLDYFTFNVSIPF